MVYGQPVYNTNQRREALRQIKKYFDKQWLKKKVAGTLKKKIILPNTEKKRRKRKALRYYKIKIKIVNRKRRKKR